MKGKVPVYAMKPYKQNTDVAPLAVNDDGSGLHPTTLRPRKEPLVHTE
jgi:hypothetical protein